MTSEFRLVHEDDTIGKLYVVEYRGIHFDITLTPGLGENGLSWGVEVETQSRDVQNVRERVPTYDPSEIRLHPTLEAAHRDAQLEVERIADAYDRARE